MGEWAYSTEWRTCLPAPDPAKLRARSGNPPYGSTSDRGATTYLHHLAADSAGARCPLVPCIVSVFTFLRHPTPPR